MSYCFKLFQSLKSYFEFDKKIYSSIELPSYQKRNCISGNLNDADDNDDDDDKRFAESSQTARGILVKIPLRILLLIASKGRFTIGISLRSYHSRRRRRRRR